jgi:ADP-heptose:LPS heptosyltransferase
VDHEDLKGTYFIPPAIRKRSRLPDSGSIRIGLHFDSNGLVKSYPDSLQGPLLRTFLDSGLELNILGTRRGSADHSNVKGLQDLRGKTGIVHSAALLEQMDAVVGVDSFVVHLAHLLGIPSVVLLSTTAPAYFEWHDRIACMTSRLECSPCLEFLDTCPVGHSECRAFFHESIAPHVILGHLMRTVSGRFPRLHIRPNGSASCTSSLRASAS